MLRNLWYRVAFIHKPPILRHQVVETFHKCGIAYSRLPCICIP